MVKFYVLMIALLAGLSQDVFGHTNTTTISRLRLVDPDFGYDGGAGQATLLRNRETKEGDNLNSRFEQFTAVANSTTVEHYHNLGVALTELTVAIYTGSGTNLTRVADPVAAGWTIAATSGFLKEKIDITTPGSGGPHTFAVVVINNPTSASLLTGTTAIANGGTGQSTATSGFDALAPTTTAGDTIYYNGTDNVRLAAGAADTVYRTNGTAPNWGKIVNANVDNAAAIAGTKVSSDFGSQNVVTTGDIRAPNLKDAAGTGAPDATNGIKIGSNETLTAYDELNWTPTLSAVSCGTTTSFSLTGRQATATRIGNRVFWKLKWSGWDMTGGTPCAGGAEVTLTIDFAGLSGLGFGVTTTTNAICNMVDIKPHTASTYDVSSANRLTNVIFVQAENSANLIGYCSGEYEYAAVDN